MERRLGARPARYARSVTPADRGARVSVRHLIHDAEHGTIPTDVVGRLVSIDDDVLMVIDRRGQLHTVAAANIVAAKTVPPHPKLPPEPPIPTRDAPLQREAARLLLIDGAARIALIAHHPDTDRVVWTGPGGGVRDGETRQDAARREAQEELGSDIAPGAVVLERTATFAFRDVWICQHETWFIATVDTLDLAQAPLHDASVSTARWWNLRELRTTSETIEPPELVDLVATITTDGVPETPWVLQER